MTAGRESAALVSRHSAGSEQIETVIIGGGQAGLSVAYHLARRGRPFVILDSYGRIGDAWRNRWDSLRLFTPAWLDGLAGMPFPAPRHSFPGKAEMADYLESYAAHFELPVRTGVTVERLSRKGDRFALAAGEHQIEADNVVVAMSSYQKPKMPAFAAELTPRMLQMHSLDYRSPSQLRAGGVLIVGAGNSGAEIALDVVTAHPTWLSGRDTGHLPFRIDGAAARIFLERLLLRGVFHRVLTTNTILGRKAYRKGSPLIAAGMYLIVRSLAASGQVDLTDPNRLITSGPYAVSRNPMYVGWTLLQLGAGVAGGSIWIIAACAAGTWWMHRQIKHEERVLAEKFTDEFDRYRAAAPRYLPTHNSSRFLAAVRRRHQRTHIGTALWHLGRN